MKVKSKYVLYAAAGMIGLTIIILLSKNAINNRTRNSIPGITDSSGLSGAVKDQIRETFQEAHRKPSAENLGELGMVYHASARYTMASQCYQLAIKKNRSAWKWPYYLGYLNMELGNADQVVENFNRVLGIDPEVHLAWYYLGESYSNLGIIDSAEKSFANIIDAKKVPLEKGTTRMDHFPLDIYAMFQLSKIYMNSGRPELAEEKLKNLIDRNELFGPAYRLLGNIYYMNGDSASGSEYIARAGDLLLFSPPVDTLIDKLALLSRSELYLLKKIDEAAQNSYSDWVLKLTEHGLDYMPGNEYLVSKAMEFYIRMGMHQEVAGLTAQHKNHFKDNYNEMGRMGMLSFQHGMYQEAQDYLATAWALKPENIEVLEPLAISVWNTGDKQKAVEILTGAAASFQDNPEILAGIAITFLGFGNTEKAILYLHKLNQVYPHDPKVRKLAGKIAELNGNVTAAITYYESSFKGDPKDTETIHSLGSLYRQQEMWISYLNLYTEAIKHHPNNPEFLNTLGSFMLGCPDESLRNLDEGIKYCKRAFINVSSPPSLMVTSGKNLAIAYYRKRDKQNALKAINKTISISHTADTSQALKNELDRLYRAILEL